MYPSVRPTNTTEDASFKKNPRYYIEGKLEQLRLVHPLIKNIHDSVIKNGLKDSDFYLFLAYYATAALIDLENEKLKEIQTSTITRAKICL